MWVPTGRTRLVLACVATLALVLPVAWLWWRSLVPDTYDLADMGYVDTGGGPGAAGAGSNEHHDHDGTPVSELVESPSRPADVTYTLEVEQDDDRITVNGTTPGPELRATQGDLVQVTLTNVDVEDGTTLHWHGVDVPNAMDGVAGVTQDAVPPGGEFVYRFVADRAGTYWYHAHQLSHRQVRQGLLGALVVDPVGGVGVDHDVTALLHSYGTDATVNGEAGLEVAADPGDTVRLRLVNTDNNLTSVWVTGTPFRLLAVDGTDLNQPGEVTDRFVGVTAGGRVDLGFTVPTGGVRIDIGGENVVAVGRPAPGDVPEEAQEAEQPEEALDLLDYGEPADAGLDAGDPDREFDYVIGRRLGFLDGKPGRWWTINGHLFPDVPMFLVNEGDVVSFRIVNDSGEDHPMHLHGHRVLVLSRDGDPVRGSPWWTDSLEVGAGEEYEIAFLADNPGIWMDHCHNLPHATEGLMTHLMYAGVSSSYLVGGGETGNRPE